MADAGGDVAASEAEILALMTAEAAGPGDRDRRAAEDSERPRPAIPLMTALDADGDGAVSPACQGRASPRSCAAWRAFQIRASRSDSVIWCRNMSGSRRNCIRLASYAFSVVSRSAARPNHM